MPERLLPLLSSIWNVAVPGPNKLVAEVTVIQSTLLVAVQEQPRRPTTTPRAVPPLAPNDVGVSVGVARQPAPWVTVTDCPAIVRYPIRAASVFRVAVNVTVPFPLPLPPAVTVSHDASVAVAVQAHPAGADTEIDGPVPPAAATAAVVGETL